MDKNVSPNYSSGQMTYLEAEAGEFLHLRRKRTASTASSFVFRFHIPVYEVQRWRWQLKVTFRLKKTSLEGNKSWNKQVLTLWLGR